MNPALFDDLRRSLEAEGPARAVEQLCSALRADKDYANLFYALLMKKRLELGAPIIDGGSAQNLLPEPMQTAYEDAIRESARLVGNLYLEDRDIPRAWPYFRLIGEPQPVADALDRYQPGPDDDCQALVDIALYQGVHPRKGFDLVLERNGICNAITLMSGEFPYGPDIREYCVGRLVRALYEQLRERLASDVASREGTDTTGLSVRQLITGRDWLVDDDFYHVDVSHLSAVVQMSIHLSSADDLVKARELCAYGARLSPRFQYAGPPPFEDTYKDHDLYLGVLTGEQVEEGLAHFRAKAEKANPESDGTYPAEVLVNLYLRANRPADALAAARQYLAGVDDRQLSCPSIAQLCQRLGDYDALADVSRQRQDPVNFLAGLIASRRGNSGPPPGLSEPRS
ncbi:MAG: hypothetical protein NZ700_02385 [Gemmataceae bacterium]|nr:hypothetical protein [Gemmataceae bacterium]MDW8265208.1 hypothetical protein [Gemmataceae bacterium]